MNALNLIMAFFLLPESRKPRARAAEKIRLNPFRHCDGCTANRACCRWPAFT